MVNDVLNDAAIDRLARWILGIADVEPAPVLHLFVQPWNVTADTTVSQLTECTAPGYSPVVLTPSLWVGSTSQGVALYQYPTVPFIFTGPGSPTQTIYGHWIEDSVTGDLLWGLTWLAPYPIPSIGSTIYLSPTWSDRQCPVPCCT
jgi:hypothetical protein